MGEISHKKARAVTLHLLAGMGAFWVIYKVLDFLDVHFT